MLGLDKHPKGWVRCHFGNYIGVFWYVVTKKFHDHPVKINLERLFMSKNENKWKLHWKLKYSESLYRFANISATNAGIFMKCYIMINYSLVRLCLKLYEELWKNLRARVLNARLHVFIASACVYDSHASIWEKIIMKFET